MRRHIYALIVPCLVSSLGACRGKDQPRSTTSAASASAVVSTSAAPSSAASAPASVAATSAVDAALPARRYRRAEGCPTADETIQAARAFAAENARDDALDAYRDAILVRPFDPNLRIELARFEILETHIQYQLALAISLTQDPKIRAKAWLALGAFYEKEKKKYGAEPRRLAYAVAERYGSEQAADKLGSESHCPAQWTTDKDPVTWVEMPPEGEGGQKRTVGDIVIRTVVGTNDPVTSRLNPMKIGQSDQDDFIDGSGTWNRDPRKCKVSPWPPPGLSRTPPTFGGGSSPLDGAPSPTLPKTTRMRFATTKGRFLFALLAFFPDVTATIADRKAHISGKGCDVDVPLP